MSDNLPRAIASCHLAWDTRDRNSNNRITRFCFQEESRNVIIPPRRCAAIAILAIVTFGIDMASELSAQQRPSTPRRLAAEEAESTLEEVGTIQGDERFLRGNRSAQEFVGSDVLDQTGFVGQQAADTTGPVVNAVEDLTRMRQQTVNLPAARERTRGLYRPRLRVDFSFPRLSNQELGSRIANQLEQTETLNLPEPIEVLVQDGTATLRGSVASQRDRRMAALLARFEPGISNVRNELEVREPIPVAPEARVPFLRSPAALRP
jgi:hypothetical protein